MKKDVKVVGIISSAREGSFSAGLVREALVGAKEAGAQIEVIELPKKKMEFCTGCLKCLKAGRCWKDDDFEAVKKQLVEADGIIWGAPVYAGAPNAIMKNLIDRLGILEMTTSSLGGKYMAGIAAAKSAGTAKKTAKKLSRFGIGGTFARSYCSGYLGEGFSKGRSLDGKALKNAAKVGAKLTKDIINARSYAMQGLPMRLISSIMMKPAFAKYIVGNREGETKALYENLHRRGLLA